MNRIFIIADTHFGHKKILQFEKTNRPFATIEEHDEELVHRWNAVVKPKDTVWHLGDVLFGRNSFAVLSRLHGIKKLVLGNHDRYPIQLYLEHFTHVAGNAELRNCILTHIPVHPTQFNRYELNIHGHLHSNTLSDRRYVNVSAEQVGLTPLLLDTLLQTRKQELIHQSL